MRGLAASRRATREQSSYIRHTQGADHSLLYCVAVHGTCLFGSFFLSFFSYQFLGISSCLENTKSRQTENKTELHELPHKDMVKSGLKYLPKGLFRFGTFCETAHYWPQCTYCGMGMMEPVQQELSGRGEWFYIQYIFLGVQEYTVVGGQLVIFCSPHNPLLPQLLYKLQCSTFSIQFKLTAETVCAWRIQLFEFYAAKYCQYIFAMTCRLYMLENSKSPRFFTITEYGSSCSSFFFCLILAPFLSLSF